LEGNDVNYLAIGDSMSIDKYTGVAGGGAVSQFARRLGAAAVLDLTYDGCTTGGVLSELEKLPAFAPGAITLTAGGNDLLEYALGFKRSGASISAISEDVAFGAVMSNYHAIAGRLSEFNCIVIVNTIYDPSDGDDDKVEAMGIPRTWRTVFDKVNDAIRDLASEYNFHLSDLAELFKGHMDSDTDSWTVMQIEPNLVGATEIAGEWYRLLSQA